jgi:D-serine deaminase-like pyridoxal phosphate-dependent protein
MFEEIHKPSLVVDMEKVRRNVQAMKDRADRNRVLFRPHLKTHQSRTIGHLLRELGVDAATVSSVSMASFFADDGWNDLTIAFPANLREMHEMDALAGRIHLGLLADSVGTVKALADGLTHEVDLWIKIDVGSRRCGIRAGDHGTLAAVAAAVTTCPALKLAGVLTHDSRSYGLRGAEAVGRVFREGRDALLSAKAFLASQGYLGLKISFGDTPSLSLVEDWSGLDEVRPGNFVYYDLQQTVIGSCFPQDVAVAVACPVVGIYPERSEAVVYGGAVHLSKQSLTLPDGRVTYGAVFRMKGDRWTGFLDGATVPSITQEHGVVHMRPEDLSALRLGDLLFLCPVHSCLSADLLRSNTIYI